MKVAIIGLGNCPDLDPVRRYVSLLPSQTVLMTNGTRGVSLATEAAAKGQGIAINVLPLEWHRFGRRAGCWSDRQNREALSLIRFAQKLHKPMEFYPLR